MASERVRANDAYLLVCTSTPPLALSLSTARLRCAVARFNVTTCVLLLSANNSNAFLKDDIFFYTNILVAKFC